MPNPKTGTVTMDVAAAVKEIKAGKVEFRADKTSLVHVPVGKLSFEPQKLIDNATTVIGAIVRSKPSAAKGKYIKSTTLSSTMGPGVRLDSDGCRRGGKALKAVEQGSVEQFVNEVKPLGSLLLWSEWLIRDLQHKPVEGEKGIKGGRARFSL
jgi:hypothetical protein